MISSSYAIVVGLSFLVLCCAIKVYRSQISIGTIRGPPSPSWLLGHQYMLRHVKNFGDCDGPWSREYGKVFRIAGVFSEPVLLVSDPKALQYIFHTSGYRFPKALDTNRVAQAFFGYGLLAAMNKDHQRQRRILNPAFSAAHLRSYLDIFQATASKLVARLKESLNNGDEVQDVLSWAKKAALDIIGITSFRYSFGALDNRKSPIRDALRNLLADAQLFPSAWDVIIFQGLQRHLPENVMSILNRLPTRENLTYRSFRTIMENNARNIYHRELQLSKDGVEQEKNIVNILAASSLSDEEKKRMEEHEIVAQMGTFIFAGHDTTANAIAWLLYELSHHPGDQDRIRKEILRARREGKALTSRDYDAMPFLNAAIKETLRLHPFVHTLIRVAQQDDVLPLSEPIKTSDGTVLKQIPIAKGQAIHASIYLYNRNPLVWGDDVDKWNPNRFLDGDHRETNLGVFANLLTFSAGVRACIGWRFAIMELQTISVELLSSFEFSVPKDAPIVVHGAGIQVMFPLLKDRPQEGEQLPLHVFLLKQKV